MPAVTNESISRTVFDMNNRLLDDYEVQLLLNGYQVIHKITSADNETLFDIWSSETDHTSIWDLHQTFTYAFTHEFRNYNYQNFATDLMIHYPYFKDW